MANLPTRPDGTIDYAEAIRLAKLNPPPSSPQELANELRLLNIRERVRVDALVREGGLEALQKERDAADSSHRLRLEAEGLARTAAESKRLQDALDARQAEMASNETPILDAQVEAKRKYDEAMAAIRDRKIEPLSESEGLAWLQRKTELKNRYDNAAAESRKPDVHGEKF
jgi:hypothetical protein